VRVAPLASTVFLCIDETIEQRPLERLQGFVALHAYQIRRRIGEEVLTIQQWQSVAC